MTVEALTQMMRAQPFQPFRIHLAVNRNVDVMHPDFVARSPAGRTIVVYHNDETFEVIDLLLVASLEILNGQRAPSTRSDES